MAERLYVRRVDGGASVRQAFGGTSSVWDQSGSETIWGNLDAVQLFVLQPGRALKDDLRLIRELNLELSGHEVYYSACCLPVI